VARASGAGIVFAYSAASEQTTGVVAVIVREDNLRHVGQVDFHSLQLRRTVRGKLRYRNRMR